MDKEKQIEEMARIIMYCPFIDVDSQAKALYEKGYRKINENEIVISKEEYEELLKLQKTYVEDLTYARTSFEEEKEDFKLNYDNHIKNLEKIIDRQSKDLNSQADRLIDLKAELENKGKETAERDFNAIIKALEERKDRVKAFYGNAESVGIDMAIDEVKKLAKEFGIDLGE